MKKTLKMSAMMLTMIAVLFLSSCGSSKASNNEVADVIKIIDNTTAQISKVSDPAEIQQINEDVTAEISAYANSDVKLTDADREALAKATYEMGCEVFKAAGYDQDFPSFNDVKEGMLPQLAKYETLGQFVTDVCNGKIG